MKDKPNLLIILALVFSFSACHIFEYIPNSLNVPLFNEKNELNGNLSVHNYQLAYSFTNHFAIATNFFWNQQSLEHGFDMFLYEKDFHPDAKNKINDFELAIGYYKNKNLLYFELFGGAGYGYMDYKHSITQQRPYNLNYNYSLKSNPVKIYLQTDIGFKFTRFLDLAFSTKLFDYHHSNLSLNVSGFDPQMEKPYDFPLDNTTNSHLYFIQPALTLRLGNDFVKFQTQTSVLFSLDNKYLNTKDGYLRLSCYFNIPIHRFVKRN